MYRRMELALAVALLTLGLAGCGSEDRMGTEPGVATQESPPPGTTATTGADTELQPSPAPGTYTGGVTGRVADTDAATASAAAPSGGTIGRASVAGRQFLTQAAHTGLLGIEAAELAAERAKSDPVRKFANAVQQTNQRQQQDLRQLAQAQGVQVPEQLDPQRVTVLEQLRKLSGAQFDRRYSQEMLRAHREAVQLYEGAAQNADDPGVQAFAEAELPVLRNHLRMAEGLPDAAPSG